MKALANVKCKNGCDTKEVTVVQVLMTNENDYSKSLYEEFKRLMKNDLDNAILICKISEWVLYTLLTKKAFAIVLFPT